ncbi:hypothetical protein SESBI_44664 [Sesbania bispinosa]|nr:hypothetical protein SESBI_44664 [Sesbania bispinosa]
MTSGHQCGDCWLDVDGRGSEIWPSEERRRQRLGRRREHVRLGFFVRVRSCVTV